jgi:mRNA-degrading endonuclease toxin of MazEF toxin-antitoxin module
VHLPHEVVGTEWTSIAMPQQVRTIDKSRLLKKIGELTDAGLRSEIENRLLKQFGIAFEIEES